MNRMREQPETAPVTTDYEEFEDFRELVVTTLDTSELENKRALLEILAVVHIV